MKNLYLDGKQLPEILAPCRLAVEMYQGKASPSLFTRAKDIASGFSGAFDNGVFAAIGQRLAALFSTAQQTDTGIGLQQSVELDSTVNSWINRNNYIKLSVVQVYKPVGLNVTYLEFISKLEEAYEYIKDIDNQMLSPLESFLMTVHNNPSMLTASSYNRRGTYNHKDVEKLAAAMGKCFNPDDVSDKYRWDEAVERNADFETACRNIGKLNGASKALGINQIRARTESIFELVESLSQSLRDNPEHAAMSRQVADRMAKELTECAQAVEFLAVVINQIHIMHVAVSDTIKHVKKLSHAF